MDKTNKTKIQQKLRQPNPLESLKDLGASTVKQLKTEAGKLPQGFMDQFLGIRGQSRNYSGEMFAGEAIEMNQVLSGKHEELVKQKKQAEYIAAIAREESQILEKKSGELKMQIKAIQEEVYVLVQETQSLAQETKLAAMQVPVEPGEYHLIFFERLLNFIRSFRKKIESAGVWLQAVNRRAAKKNAWGANYKKHGAKYLLSGEHYLQRSAG